MTKSIAECMQFDPERIMIELTEQTSPEPLEWLKRRGPAAANSRMPQRSPSSTPHRHWISR